jgi:hypothetical protein
MLVFIVVCGAALAVLLIRPGATHEPNRSSPPIYPGAQAIREEHVGLNESDLVYKRITFTTDDSPSSVFTFYEDALTKDGWTLLEQRSPNRLRFQSTSESVGAGTSLLYYWVDVVVEQPSAGQTDVQIEMSAQQR